MKTTHYTKVLDFSAMLILPNDERGVMLTIVAGKTECTYNLSNEQARKLVHILQDTLNR